MKYLASLSYNYEFDALMRIKHEDSDIDADNKPAIIICIFFQMWKLLQIPISSVVPYYTTSQTIEHTVTRPPNPPSLPRHS